MSLKVKEFAKLLEHKSLAQCMKLMCGEKIGVGLYRDVYILKQNSNYVLKVERDMSSGRFANVGEWLNWCNNKDWEWLAEWLAPCELINETGQLMIQRRIEHGKRKDYPTHIPAVFTDLKLTNFGWIGEQFVCCDYAFMKTIVITTPTKYSKRPMQYAKWWNVEIKKPRKKNRA